MFECPVGVAAVRGVFLAQTAVGRSHTNCKLRSLQLDSAVWLAVLERQPTSSQQNACRHVTLGTFVAISRTLVYYMTVVRDLESPVVCDLRDAPTALAACCGFDLCYDYIWYLVFAGRSDVNEAGRMSRSEGSAAAGDVVHFLLVCSHWSAERELLMSNVLLSDIPLSMKACVGSTDANPAMWLRLMLGGPMPEMGVEYTEAIAVLLKRISSRMWDRDVSDIDVDRARQAVRDRTTLYWVTFRHIKNWYLQRAVLAGYDRV